MATIGLKNLLTKVQLQVVAIYGKLYSLGQFMPNLPPELPDAFKSG